MASTIRISEASHRVLKELADERGVNLQEALDVVTSEWKRRQFFQALNASFVSLKSNPDNWKEELEERRAWDQTLLDHQDPQDA